MMYVQAQRLHKVALALFKAAGTPDDIATSVVDILIESNLAGHDSHGVQLIPNYMSGVKNGTIVADARPSIVEETATTALVSGHWGWGQQTAAYGAELAI